MSGKFRIFAVSNLVGKITPYRHLQYGDQKQQSAEFFEDDDKKIAPDSSPFRHYSISGTKSICKILIINYISKRRLFHY